MQSHYKRQTDHYEAYSNSEKLHQNHWHLKYILVDGWRCGVGERLSYSALTLKPGGPYPPVTLALAFLIVTTPFYSPSCIQFDILREIT